MSEADFVWDDDRKAQSFLHESGYRLTKTFHYVHPKRKTPTEKEWAAIHYLCWEWDFGGYFKTPPKKCESKHVGRYGECLFCDAENGEVCKMGKLKTTPTAS